MRGGDPARGRHALSGSTGPDVLIPEVPAHGTSNNTLPGQEMNRSPKRITRHGQNLT